MPFVDHTSTIVFKSSSSPILILGFSPGVGNPMVPITDPPAGAVNVTFHPLGPAPLGESSNLILAYAGAASVPENSSNLKE